MNLPTPYQHDAVKDHALLGLDRSDHVGPHEVATYLTRLAANEALADDIIHDSFCDLMAHEVAQIARHAAACDDAAIGSIVGATIRSEAMKALRKRLAERPREAA